jgi:tetratricopeptide (TPR) repeat protein
VLLGVASATAWLGRLELLAGDAAAAAELNEEACRLLEQAENWGNLSTQAGWQGQALYALGKLEDAGIWAARAAELAAPDDPLTQMLWRQVKAKLLARNGDHAAAERLAREAVAVGEETDQLYDTANAYSDLAEVLELAGKSGETREALERALDLYQRKGCALMAERTEALLLECPA